FERARRDYEAALHLAGQGANRAGEWQALVDLGLLWQTRDLERAGEFYQRALEVARTLGDAHILAQTLNRYGNWLMNRGNAQQALPYHQEALETFREAGDRRGMAHTMDLLGIVSFQLGEVIQGAEYLEEAVPILRELDDRQGLVNTLVNLTVRAIIDTEVLGEISYAQLTGLSDEALQIARGFHWHEGEILSLMQGAISLKQTGEYGQALQRLALAHSMADESRNRESIARCHLVAGEIYHELFALAEAKEHLETALASLLELGSGILILGAKMNLATVAILLTDTAGARAILADLLPGEYPRGHEVFPLRRCWYVWAELELAQGKPHQALAIVDRLLAAAPGLAQYGPQAVPRLSRLRGNALAALGRLDDAERELQGTLPLAFKRGQRPLLWRLHADLGHVYRAMGRRDDARREFASARTIVQELATALPDRLLGEHFLEQALKTMPAASAPTARQAAKKDSGGLTGRERQVAALISLGRSNREIANELVISEKTVERHVANIMAKLGFNSRVQIAAWMAHKEMGK
ncbi:MAG TPA: tetratricopeptide repeat protein, partial [Anaerolineales bacterium]